MIKILRQTLQSHCVEKIPADSVRGETKTKEGENKKALPPF